MLRRSLIVVRKNVSQESAKANQYIGRLKINLLQKAAMVFSRGDGRASSRSFQPPAEGRRKSTLSRHGIVICSSSVGIAESQAKGASEIKHGQSYSGALYERAFYPLFAGSLR